MRNKLIAFFITALMLSSIVFGAVSDDVKTARSNELNARYGHLRCRVDLTNSQIDSFAKYISSVDLSAQKAKLTSDLSTLQGYVTSDDRKGFDSYATTTLKSDFQDVTNSLKDAKKNARGMNITKENIEALRAEINNERTAFGQCNANAEKALVEAHIAYYNAWIAHWNDVIAKLKAKGYDTSAMEAVVSDAQTKLIPALQAIESATDAAAIKQARDDARDLALHLWARFAIARLQAVENLIKSKVTSPDAQAKFADIDSKLSEASSLATPGRKYGPGDFEKVWNDIKQAAQQLTVLAKQIRQEAREARMAANRTAPATNSS